MATFSGALAWPYLYPWPQRPAGLIDTAFDELARRWKPLLDAAEENGVDLCYEIHPGEDLYDGTTFEMFLERLGGHPRCNMLYDPSHFVLQCLDYLDHIDIYHERHQDVPRQGRRVQPDRPAGRLFGGYQPWVDRAGRFRSPRRRPGRLRRGLLQARRHTTSPAGRWSSGSARSSTPRTARARARSSSKAHIIRVTEKAFDDFAGGGTDEAANRRLLGLA